MEKKKEDEFEWLQICNLIEIDKQAMKKVLVYMRRLYLILLWLAFEFATSTWVESNECLGINAI